MNNIQNFKKIMTKRYFATDGIRGLVGSEKINSDIAYRLGQALVLFCLENNLKTKIIIGHDTRWSVAELETALIAGIKKFNGEVARVGTIPSPGMSYLTRLENVSLGVMITASHNDHRYNGFKIFTADGEKFSDIDEARIEDLIDEAEGLNPENEIKHSEEINEAFREKYEKSLLDIFQADDFSDLNIVLDCANGAAYEVAPNVFLNITKANILHIFPNGKNINDDCGSLYPSKLSREVTEHKAHIGLAFDGDADRITVVDEKGNVLNGDHIMHILSRMMNEQGELKSGTVVSTVMSNLGFVRSLNSDGIKHHQTDVGDSIVYDAMKELGANLGGEEAGHIILRDHNTSGDGILCALMMLRALKHFKKPLSELAQGFTSYPKILNNIEVNSKPELENFPELLELIKNIETEMGSRGRVLVRYSGTEPKCRVMVEHEDEKTAIKYVDVISEKIKELISN